MPQAPFENLLRFLFRASAAGSAGELTDRQILDRFQSLGQETVITLLIQRHGRMVYTVARRAVGNAHDAEDVFQATFLVMARKLRSIGGKKSVGGWLHGVAQRIAWKVRAKASTRRRHEREMQIMKRNEAEHDALTCDELRAVLDAEIGALAEKYRTPLVLCFLEGRSYDQAARELGCAKSTLASRLTKALGLLRAKLQRRGIGLTAAALAATLGEMAEAAPVSGVLMANTVKGAALAAVGKGVADGFITASALALAKEALAGMVWMKMVVMVAGVIGLGLVGARWAEYAPSPAGSTQQPEAHIIQPEAPVRAAPAGAAGSEPRVDIHGDRLPEGAAMRLGTVQLRTAGAGLAATPDGKTLIGVRRGKYLSFWDLQSGKLKETRELRTPESSLAVLSSDGRFLATGECEVWDVHTGALVRKLDLPGSGYPGCTAFSPDGNCLVTVHRNQRGLSIGAWHVTSGKELFSKEIHADTNPVCACFTPDGKRLVASFMANEIGTCCWDLATSELLWQHKSNGWNPSRLPAFSADGKTLLSSRPALNLDTGKAAKLGNIVPRFGNLVLAMPDGRTILISRVGAISVCDIASGKVVKTLDEVGGEMLVTPDGKSVITNSGFLQRWDSATWKPQFADNFEHGHSQKVTALIFSIDGQRLASAGADGSVRLWNVATGQPIHVWRGHQAARPIPMTVMEFNGVRALDMTPDSHRIVSVGGQQDLRVWNGETGKEVHDIYLQDRDSLFVSSLRISPDGRNALGIFKPHWLGNWDLQAGTLLSRRSLGRAGILSRDGKLLVSKTGVENVTTREFTQFEKIEPYTDMDSETFSGDGALVAQYCSVGAGDNLRPAGVLVWEASTGKLVVHMKIDPSYGRLEFHPLGRHLVVNDDDGIRILDLNTGNVSRSVHIPKDIHSWHAAATSLAFTPDGHRLATGHPDGQILVWNVDLPTPPPARILAEELERLWNDLKDADAAKAWKSVRRLTDSPDDAVPFLRERLKRVASAPEEATRPLLADLDGESFAKREAAGKRLLELGVLAEAALRTRLKENSSLETQRRIEALLKKIAETPQPLSQEMLRDIRAVAVLARISQAGARAILERLANGAESARLTEVAKAALIR